MAKATKMNVNYRESILDRAYRLELIKKMSMQNIKKNYHY